MFTSLQRKLLTMILSAAIICTGIMGWSWYQSHTSMFNESVKERMQVEARMIGQMAGQALEQHDSEAAEKILNAALATDEHFHAIHL